MNLQSQSDLIKKAISEFNNAVNDLMPIVENDLMLIVEIERPESIKNVKLETTELLDSYIFWCIDAKYEGYTVHNEQYINHFNKKRELLEGILKRIASTIEDNIRIEEISNSSFREILFNCYFLLGDFDKAIQLNKQILELCKSKKTSCSELDLILGVMNAGLQKEDFNEIWEVMNSLDFEFFYDRYPDSSVDFTEDMTNISRNFRKAITIIEKKSQEKSKLLEELQKTVDEKTVLNEKLQQKEKDLEDIMAMFSHKFRSPLDAIIYNTNHENNPKMYIEAAQTMRGLLDIFSIISTNEKDLQEKIKGDNRGESRLLKVFNNTLKMMMLHLLSASSVGKIQQHCMAYAKATGKIDASITPKVWNDEYFELESEIQKEWENSFSELLNQSGSLQESLNWIEQHFFKLELVGFERADIQFKDYSTTESFLTILLNEILVNVFKYYSSETKEPVVLELLERDEHQVIVCRNPSVRRERLAMKGSGKGHVFLSALANKIGSEFSKPKPLDNFVIEFAIPNELLITNQGDKE